MRQRRAVARQRFHPGENASQYIMPRPKSIHLPEKIPVGSQPICFKRIERLDPVWCSGRVPLRFWENEKNHRDYLLWLAHKLRFRRMEQWYSVKGKDFIRNYGRTVLKHYRGSPSEMLRTLLPEYDWCEWLFVQVPDGFWDVPANQLRFVEWLGHEMGVCHWQDWYRVTETDVKQNGGDCLLTRYNYSLLRIFSSLFPEHDWKPWLFRWTPRGFWDQPENRRRYMLWLGEQLGFRKMEDWYRVRVRDFQQHRGGTLLESCRLGSIPAVLADAFPEYTWDMQRFRKRATGAGKIIRHPKGFWMVRANRLRYLRGLGRQLGFLRPEDWYQVTGADFRRYQGFGILLSSYRSCPVLAAMELYPKYPWKEWLFPRVPKGFWNQPENHRRYMDWLGKQLGFHQPEDWYHVHQRDFANNHGNALVSRYGSSLRNLLRQLLPDLDWDKQWSTPRNGNRLAAHTADHKKAC